MAKNTNTAGIKMSKNKDTKKLVGSVIDGRYKIEEFLGTGGMSTVYRALDLDEERTVAIKMLRDEMADDEEAMERFTNESRAVSMLSHPNIVGIYDVALDGENKYLVMEYMEGISLRDYMDGKGALDFDEIISFCKQILAALDHAHSKGIIHRDIKPQNIMMLEGGIIKVTDFGIAKLPDSKKSTVSEKAIGTVSYISPEQASGKRADARSDLYSLGVMMYEMATGALPFDDERSISVIMMHLHDKPIPPRQKNPKLSRGLEQIILYAMEKDPRHRYSNAREMFAQIHRLDGRPRAAVMPPKKARVVARTKKNRKQQPPSRSMTPIILGIAFAILFVALVALFYGLDALMIATPGNESLSVPDVVGLEYSNAASIGFDKRDYLVSVEYVHSSTVPKNHIISQEPTAGSKRKSPCSVSLVISKGPQYVILGDYTMMDWRYAQAQLRSEGFAINIERVESSTVPASFVISTSPAPGSQIERGATVTITISNGIDMPIYSLPELVGMRETAVKALLDEHNLYVGDVVYTRSSKPAGTVIGCSHKGGTNVYEGATVIDFVVSGGGDFKINICPDIDDMPLSEAVDTLNLYGIKVVTNVISSKKPKDTILEQIPSSENVVKNNVSTVTLTVSGGDDFKNTITLLDLTSQPLDVAKTLLDFCCEGQCRVNLDIKYVINDAPAGTVIAQAPQAGTVEVSLGVLYVTFTVSGGPDYIPPDVTLLVPDVYGFTVDEAREALAEYGILLGEVITVASDYDIGLVCGQSAEPDSEITGPEGYISIDIYISGGPDYADPTTPSEEETTASPDGESTTSPDGGDTTNAPSEETTTPEAN